MLKDITQPVFDQQIFKGIMRRVAGTVVVISTTNEGVMHGLTATAMCSVSVDPPKILVVVNKTSRTHPHIIRKQAFTVNVLARDQQDVADLFASKTENQFGQVSHDRTDDDCPVIIGATAYLHCSVDDLFDVGSHTIFVGRVLDGSFSDEIPLIYHDAQYLSIRNS